MAYEIRFRNKKRNSFKAAVRRRNSIVPPHYTKIPGESDDTGDVRGITLAGVLRVFPGARVLTKDKAEALKDESASERVPQQLRLIPGGEVVMKCERKHFSKLSEISIGFLLRNKR